MKIKKITILIAIVLTFVIVCSTNVYANGFTFPSWSELSSSANNFLSKGGTGHTSQSQLNSVFVPMARILLGFGVIVLVAVTIIMGIKYMFASPEEAAKLKQQLIGLVISGAVIFGAAGIWAFIYNVLDSVL